MSLLTTSIVRFLILGVSLRSIGEAAHRSRRELRFPKGCSLVAGVAVTGILPKGLTDGFVHVLEFDLGFPFPDQSTIDGAQSSKRRVSSWKNPYPSLTTRKGFETKRKGQKKYRRNVKDEQKRKLLSKVEDAITSLGHNGRACVVRFQCELSTIAPENSLLEEVLLSLFKPSPQFSREECFHIREQCELSLLHALLHSEQMVTAPETTANLNDFHSINPSSSI